MKPVYFSLLAVVLLIFSCKKDKKDEPEQLPETITTGVITGMEVQIYDTTFSGGYNKPEYFYFDLNKDGEDDIQLKSVLTGSPGMGAFPETSIGSLHPALKLHGIESFDTTFRNLTFSWYYDQQYNKYWKTFNYTFTCNRISAGDNIVNINPAFKLKPLEQNDPINVFDNFSPTSITLRRGNRLPDPPQHIGVNGDTIYYERKIYLSDCNLFPVDRKLYIGFVLNEELLGWICITHSDYTSITVHESAIQKK